MRPSSPGSWRLAFLLLAAWCARPAAARASEHVLSVWGGKVHVTVPALPPGWVFVAEKSSDTWLRFHKDGDGPDYDGLWCSFIVNSRSNRFATLEDYRRWHGAYEKSAGSADAVRMEDSQIDGRRVFRFQCTIRRPPQQKMSLGKPYTEPGFYQIDDNSVAFGLLGQGPPNGELDIIIRDTSTVWMKPEEAAWVENAYAEAKALRAGLRFRTEAATAAKPPGSVATPAPSGQPPDSVPWAVIIGTGAAGAAALAGAAKIIAGKLRSDKTGANAPDAVPVGYVLQLGVDELHLIEGSPQKLRIDVWAVDPRAGYRAAPEAAIEIVPAGALAPCISVTPRSGRGALTCEIALTAPPDGAPEGQLEISARAPKGRGTSAIVKLSSVQLPVLEFF